MIRKGFLQSVDGIETLKPYSTSIGRENCDIIIDDVSSDQQHAVIEYSAEEDCFVLHDLNTAQGTYVNDCRIQNAAVRLAPGDSIKFSHSGKAYELRLETPSKIYHYLPVPQRPSWNSPIQIVVSSPRSERSGGDSSTFPLIGMSKASTTPSPPKSTCVQPHPPLRARPFSAEPPTQTTTTTLPFTDHSRSHSGGEWASSVGSALRERDMKILHMGDELKRLAIFEQESNRKDNTISCLRDEVARLEEKAGGNQQLSSTQVFQKLQSLEQEICLRRNEVTMLRDQLSAVNKTLTASPTLTSQLTESEKKVHCLRQDYDAAKRECAMSQGLIQSLQREVQSKDDELKKVTTEVNHLRREIKRKDVQLSSISSKFTKMSEDKSKDEQISALQRELKDAKIKIRMLESRSTDQLNLLQTYKDEISNSQAKKQTIVDENKASLKQLEDMKQKYFEVQRAERILRVDLEQSQSRLERFRMRVLNTLFTSPGLHLPDDLQSVDDNTTVDNIKKIIKQRLDMKSKVDSLEEELASKTKRLTDLRSSFETCKNAVDEMMERIKTGGHQSRLLKNEGDLLSSLALSDECFAWVYQSFAAFLGDETQWNATLEEALVEAGYDVSIDDRNPAVHITDLFGMLTSERTAHQSAIDSYKQLELQHQEELQNNIEKLLKENEEKLASQMEKIRLEEQEKFEESVKELQQKEEEKRLRALEEERDKIASANLGIEQLQKMLAEKQAEESDFKNKLQNAFKDIEEQKNIEAQLRREMIELERQHKLELTTINENNQMNLNKHEEEIKQYKEGMHQHSITIVSMETQIQNLTAQCQEAEKQKKSLRSKLKEMESRRKTPTPPQTPPVQAGVKEASEQEIAFLKAELFHSGQEIMMLKNTIVGLRRDLAGSQARITDMTGELSESQKLELEQNRRRCKDQEVELNTIRQKLIKMSALVDAQEEDISKMKSSIRKQEQEASAQENETKLQHNNIKELEAQLEKEKSKIQETNQIQAKKGKIADELAGVGSRCRGERHEDIISRQCQALAELRARVKALEQIRPPLPSQEQALQQVILLKKELAEIRAKQAIEEDKHFQSRMSLDQEVIDSQQQIRTANTQASIERSSREQIQMGIESAERTYMDLLNSTSSLLGINNLRGSGTIQHLPKDEVDRVCEERKMDLEKITSSIKSLLQQLDRKEQLLQGYEKDLAKLRDAESFASQKSNRVEALSEQVMEKSEEINHLREALNQTKERLELEKRLNKAIKQRKTFHLENLDLRHQPPRPPSTYRSEFEEIKKETKKAKQQNKLKRKQYEIDVLKQRVHGKERELCNTTARLVNLESSSSYHYGDEIAQIHQERERSREECYSVES